MPESEPEPEQSKAARVRSELPHSHSDVRGGAMADNAATCYLHSEHPNLQSSLASFMGVCLCS